MADTRLPESADETALVGEIASLRAALDEAESTLRAIQSGRVDAVVVDGVDGTGIYMLQRAEQPYRQFVEQMQEGAVTLGADGRILYCNQHFADMLASTVGQVTGCEMEPLVAPSDRSLLEGLRTEGAERTVKSEITLVAFDGRRVPAYLAVSPLTYDRTPRVCLVVTDLTHQKRNEEIVASEKLARSILENAAEAIVVCEVDGTITRANAAAQALCATNPIRRPFHQAFPLSSPADGAPLADAIGAAVSGGSPSGLEARLRRPDGSTREVLLSAGLLRGSAGEPLGSVVTLTDVTHVRESQAEIEALNGRLRRAMTETHHRVKNNLQVIAAMVDMRVMEGSDTVPMEEFRRLATTVRALASVHEILTQEHSDQQDQGLSSRAVLGKLLPLLSGTLAGRQLRADIQDLKLSPRQGTSLALVVSELVSNAIKHGSGDVDVRLVGDEGTAVLEVCDHGPGFPPGFDPARSASTGLELVEHLSRWDLGGEAEYGRAPHGGACVRVTVALVEPAAEH